MRDITCMFYRLIIYGNDTIDVALQWKIAVSNAQSILGDRDGVLVVFKAQTNVINCRNCHIIKYSINNGEFVWGRDLNPNVSTHTASNRSYNLITGIDTLTNRKKYKLS